MAPKRRRTGGRAASSTPRRSINAAAVTADGSDHDQLMPDADADPNQDVDVPLEDVADDNTQQVVVPDDDEPPTLPDDDAAEAVATLVDDTEIQGDDLDDDDVTTSSVPKSAAARRRRGGPRSRQSRVGFESPDPNDDASESGATNRRSRGGFRGGFRGRPKYGPKLQPDRVPVDKEGTMMDVVDDEVALPEDPEGETKVDKDGNLQGGRRYRVRVFTIEGRGGRLYMLSTEPARCTGFRDSYLFFAKHLTLYKVVLNDEQKKDLIARDIMPNSYKGRSIGVVTARSVFREFGPRIIVGGRRVTDDYYAQAARDKGYVEGELADPSDKVPTPGETYNRNQYVAWHGASQVYHTNANPSVPVASGRPAQTKRRLHITTVNWQYEHAKEASKFNSTLATVRRATANGQYDLHSNLILRPRITQPTHVKWQHASSDDTRQSTPSNHPSIFPPLDPIILCNFFISDTVFQNPPETNFGLPGADADLSSTIFPGSANGLSDISAELVAELPADCKEAFLAARRQELTWKEKWRSETVDGMRTQLRIGLNGFPV